MSIVGSWIDDKEMAALMNRLGPAPSATGEPPDADCLMRDPHCVERVTPDSMVPKPEPSPPEMDREMPKARLFFPEPETKPKAAPVPSKLDQVMPEPEPATKETVRESPSPRLVEVEPEKVHEGGTREAEHRPGNPKGPDGALQSVDPMEHGAEQPAARQAERRGVPPVAQRLAEIKAQASASGLLNPAREVSPEKSSPPDLESTGAGAPSVIADALAGETLGDRLLAFVRDLAGRYRCVRVLVVDSRGYSLLGPEKSEEALVAAALTLSQSWIGCRKHLRLKEKGAVSAVLGKGYRMMVLPCETALGLVTLAIVTNRIVSDEDIDAMRVELGRVVHGR